MLRHMQLKAAKIFARRRVRRSAEEGREVPHVANVVPLGVFAEPARRHVVDHALPQRADGLVRHRESSCLAWVEPHDLETGSRLRVGPVLRVLAALAASTARAVSFAGGILPLRGDHWTAGLLDSAGDLLCPLYVDSGPSSPGCVDSCHRWGARGIDLRSIFFKPTYPLPRQRRNRTDGQTI